MLPKYWRNGGAEWSLRGPRKALEVAQRQEVAGVELASTRSAKKDTKRWCKGKVGREHGYSEPVRLYPTMTGWASQLHEQLCRTCGKKRLLTMREAEAYLANEESKAQ